MDRQEKHCAKHMPSFAIDRIGWLHKNTNTKKNVFSTTSPNVSYLLNLVVFFPFLFLFIFFLPCLTKHIVISTSATKFQQFYTS